MKTLVLLALLSQALFAYPVILKESQELPITTFNITFRVGSADDPKDMKGLAHLTSALLREGGVKSYGELPKRSRSEIEDFLFPLAADLEVSTSREQTSIEVTTTAESAESIFDLITQIILAPDFSDSELDRLKSETKDVLEKKLPLEDQEELGKAALERVLYGEGHPYSHVVYGKAEGVSKINKEKIEEFYKANYTQKKITVGAGGVLSESLKKKLGTVFLKLPEGTETNAFIPKVAPNPKLNLTIVTGPFEATGVHIGLVQPVTRNSPDFPAMYLASNAFGKHRSFVGRLMQVVREIRGLNYGTYSYVEEFPNGGHAMIAPNQVARQLQSFTMWGRPTPVDNGCFLFKQMLREYDLLATKGLAIKEFQLGQSHLNGYIPLLGTEISRQLGYAIDSQFYGITGDFLAQLQKSNEKLTHAKVNEIVSKNLKFGKPSIVVVTKDAQKFLKDLKSGNCQIHYPPGVTKPKNILAEDAVISKYPVTLEAAQIKVIPSIDFF